MTSLGMAEPTDTAEPAFRLSEVVVLERDVSGGPTLDRDDDGLAVGRVPELAGPRVETLRPLSDAQLAALTLLREEVAQWAGRLRALDECVEL